jgi:hypothetical protein
MRIAQFVRGVGGRRAALAMVLLGAVTSTVHAQTVTVSSVTQLRDAVNAANGGSSNRTILLADGTYTLTDTLYVNASNVTIAGQSGDRTKVIIQGDAMSASARVGTLIRAAGSNFKLENVTLQRSRYHLIQIVGENNADGPVIRNCILRDAYEQMIKVSIDPANLSVASDNGLVENCVFEYTAGIGPQYYIAGIDAHGSKNWTVRGNTFKGIASPSVTVAEPAVHFWNGSANNVVERNTFINCDRSIGFGMDGRGNSGGIIRNNMIFHSGAGSYADTAISLIESPGTSVYNNTILMQGSFPWAIEYRFASTTNVRILNNLTNKPIQARDGASGTVSSNVTNAQASWFVAPASGNLHLASAQSAVVDKGQTISGLTDDFDGESRPQGAGIDIGADEYGGTAVVAPKPPTNVRVN